MAPGIFIGIAAGIASAILALFPLPLYIAGFGWGVASAVAGSIAGALFIGVLAGPSPAVTHILIVALPCTTICWLAFSGANSAANTDATSKRPLGPWYPVGSILAHITVYAGALGALATLVIGTDFESYKSTIEGALTSEVLERLKEMTGQTLGDADVALLLDLTVRLYPSVIAVSWLLMTVFCAWLGALIARSSKRLYRPWPDFAMMDFPAGVTLIFGLALGLSLLPGLLGVIANGITNAMIVGHALLGLAMIHGATRGLNQRTPILVAVYLSILLFGRYAIALLAIYGVAEPMLGLRDRAALRVKST